MTSTAPFRIEGDFSPLSGVWALGTYSETGATERRHLSEVGTLLNQSKYAVARTKTSEEAFAALSGGLISLVENEPEIESPTVLVWIPGSEPQTKGFSELLGEDVARGLGILGVGLERRLPAGSAQKVKPRSMVGALQLSQTLDAQRVLVLDDVLNTGSSMCSAGQAVVAAGASSAWGIVAAQRV